MRLRELTARFTTLAELSNVLLLNGATIETISVPTTWVGPTALSFRVGQVADSNRLSPLRDFLGTPISIAIQPGWVTQLPVGAIRGNRFMVLIPGADPSSPEMVDNAVDVLLMVRDYE
jgi:hypothetical protein